MLLRNRLLARGAKKFAPAINAGGLLTQQARTLISEDHYIYRPTDGQAIPFSIFSTEEAFGEWDITRSIIMLPTWFGPTDNIKQIAQEFCNQTNWRVFLPDIYGSGHVANTVEEAEKMFGELDYSQTIEDIGWLAKKLRQYQPGSGLATVGFSAGGAMALEAAAASDDIFACASFYGLPPKSSWDDLAWSLVKNEKPIHLQFGGSDTIFPYTEAEEFRQLLKHNRNKFQCFVYPGAGHAFMESVETAHMLEQGHYPELQGLALSRSCQFLLENTPMFDIDDIGQDDFRWTDHWHTTPSDPDYASQWKAY